MSHGSPVTIRTENFPSIGTTKYDTQFTLLYYGGLLSTRISQNESPHWTASLPELDPMARINLALAEEKKIAFLQSEPNYKVSRTTSVQQY